MFTYSTKNSSNVSDLLAETRKLILKKRDERDNIADPMLTKLGFTERDLTNEEKALYRMHEFDVSACYVAQDDKYEVTIFDREWDRSKAFQTRGDRIEITLVAKNLKTGEVSQERFEWNEKSLFGDD